MKVGGSTTAAPVSAGGVRRAASAPGFLPSEAPASVGAPSAASGPAGVAGLDALLMLQEPEDATSRRRRAVRRADSILDRLDALKLAVMGEGEPQAALERLAQALRERRSAVDEPGLDEVLDAVETRAAVELAKREARQAAA